LINVKGAIDPYILVFLESYSNDWELVDPNRNSPDLISQIVRAFANIGRTGTRIFINDSISDNSSIATYLNGGVVEGKHRNILLEPNTFETWGKEVIANNRHIFADNYANAWNITPEDMDKKSEYTLVLELKTQRL